MSKKYEPRHASAVMAINGVHFYNKLINRIGISMHRYLNVFRYKDNPYFSGSGNMTPFHCDVYTSTYVPLDMYKRMDLSPMIPNVTLGILLPP